MVKKGDEKLRQAVADFRSQTEIAGRFLMRHLPGMKEALEIGCSCSAGDRLCRAALAQVPVPKPGGKPHAAYIFKHAKFPRGPSLIRKCRQNIVIPSLSWARPHLPGARQDRSVLSGTALALPVQFLQSRFTTPRKPCSDICRTRTVDMQRPRSCVLWDRSTSRACCRCCDGHQLWFRLPV